MFTTEEAQERADELDRLHRQLACTVRLLEPGGVTATDAADLLRRLVSIERLAGAGRVILSARAAEAGTWRAKGHRSPEDWLAAEQGTSTGDARGDLDTSKRLGDCPKTEEALRRGKVSPKQAQDITDATTADPAAEQDLLDLVEKGASKKELRDEARRRKAAADPDPDATARRIHRNRHVRTGTDPDGTWWLAARGPTAAGAGIMATLRREADRIFQANHRAGVREHPEAYLFDALTHLLTGTATSAAGGSGSAGRDANTHSSSSGSETSSSGAAAPTTSTSAPTSTPAPSAAPVSSPEARPHAAGSSELPGSHAPDTTYPAPAPSASASSRAPNAAPSTDATCRAPGPGPAPAATTPSGDPAGSGAVRPASTAGPAPTRQTHPPHPPGPFGPTADSPAGTPPAPPPRDPAPDTAPTGDALRLPGLDPPGPPPAPVLVGPTGANAKIIVRIDHTALVRGHTEAGEISEIEGMGHVPVEQVRAWMTDAFLAAVLTNGTDITRVVHLGRRPTALQTTALQAAGVRCQRLGCGRTEGLQIDHRIDWSQTKHTTLSELDWLCRYDHSLKTLYGWALEPGTGPRRLLHPDHPDHPGNRAA